MLGAPAAKLPTEGPTIVPHPSATASPTPLPPSPVPTRVTAASSTPVSTALASLTPTAISTPIVSLLTLSIENSHPPINVADPTLPILAQAMSIGGFILWIGLARLSRAITTEMRTVSLATLRLQHEAERIERREKVVFRADTMC